MTTKYSTLESIRVNVAMYGDNEKYTEATLALPAYNEDGKRDRYIARGYAARNDKETRDDKAAAIKVALVRALELLAIEIRCDILETEGWTFD